MPRNVGGPSEARTLSDDLNMFYIYSLMYSLIVLSTEYIISININFLKPLAIGLY